MNREQSSHQIQPHHQRAIDRLVEEYGNDPRFEALIIGGSVAKGYARPDSDVDFLIVATDEEFASRESREDLFINRTDLCDYEGGFVDGKIIDLAYLRRLAESGNEPSRAAFTGAFAAFLHLPELDQLITSIPVYPEQDREHRINAFYSMAFIQHWLMNEAVRHQNRYTITRAASQLALYTGRLLLAYNRVLFPYHKWFIKALESAREKPQGFLSDMDALLVSPGMKTADKLFKSVRNFRDWGVSDLDAFTWFLKDVELAWMDGKAPMEDW